MKIFRTDRSFALPRFLFHGSAVMLKILILNLICFFPVSLVLADQPVFSIFPGSSSPMVNFAISKIESSLKKQGILAEIKQSDALSRKALHKGASVVFMLTENGRDRELMRDHHVFPAENIESEGFCIRVTTGSKPVFWVIARDEAGLMYGGLELAETILTGGPDAVQDFEKNPYMKMRGIKFNIPLDMRTPSYSDVSDVAQLNMEEVWDFGFWKEFIDSLASYRYNFVSLWSLHPFPSMVKVPEYSDIALDDVRRSTVHWKEDYNLSGQGFDEPEILDHYEVIRNMTMEEKIEFWRKVMKYGKERNIRFYIITWNIFTYGTEGKYGITDDADNPVTRDYFRKSVREMLLTYPDLAGIGLTTGENMYGLSNEVKEDWAFDTYGRGVMDAALEQPAREFTLIHRQHMSNARQIAQKFSPLTKLDNVKFIFSFKYAKAHVYSSVNQVYHQDFVRDIGKDKNLKTIWTLRNDDVYYFRWGAPDFVRQFIKKIPIGVSEGYYLGSDQWVWGRDYLELNTNGNHPIELAKHWYHWMMWGRLGYDPAMDNERFIELLKARFPSVDPVNMFDAWENASMIYPLVTGFHWGALDFQWYIEASKSRPDPAQTPSGFHDVNRFISLSPHPGTDNLSIPEYVANVTANAGNKGTTPEEVADEILDRTASALHWAAGVHAGDPGELQRTASDICSMAWLGRYYAHKIRAATYLALFRKTFDPAYHEIVINELKQSAVCWRYYASNSLFMNRNPVWTNRVGYVDWRELYRYVLYDITANGGNLNLPSMEPTPGGKILEAEEGDHPGNEVRSDIGGFTGTGYLEVRRSGDAGQKVNWTYDATEAGTYILEFRYTLKRQENMEARVMVNGGSEDSFLFWPSGKTGNWVWDRKVVQLKKGKNEISVKTMGFVLFDHLNVIKI